MEACRDLSTKRRLVTSVTLWKLYPREGNLLFPGCAAQIVRTFWRRPFFYSCRKSTYGSASCSLVTISALRAWRYDWPVGCRFSKNFGAATKMLSPGRSSVWVCAALLQIVWNLILQSVENVYLILMRKWESWDESPWIRLIMCQFFALQLLMLVVFHYCAAVGMTVTGG
jgi:hypothetical protein